VQTHMLMMDSTSAWHNINTWTEAGRWRGVTSPPRELTNNTVLGSRQFRLRLTIERSSGTSRLGGLLVAMPCGAAECRAIRITSYTTTTASGAHRAMRIKFLLIEPNPSRTQTLRAKDCIDQLLVAAESKPGCRPKAPVRCFVDALSGPGLS
jgi:hypothetical protein